MNKYTNKYFFPRERGEIKEVTEQLGLEYIGGNELWGGKRRFLYDSRYIFGKPEDMSIDEYIEKCKKIRPLLEAKFTPVVVLKLDGLKIAICHPRLTLPCDDKGMLLDRVRYLTDPTAAEYQKRFPQNCL